MVCFSGGYEVGGSTRHGVNHSNHPVRKACAWRSLRRLEVAGEIAGDDGRDDLCGIFGCDLYRGLELALSYGDESFKGEWKEGCTA